MRLTEKRELAKYGYKYLGGADNFGEGCQKLGQLEDLEDELGIDLITFLKETFYVLKHSKTTIGYLSDGTKIGADFGYVEEFIEEMKKALTKEELL